MRAPVVADHHHCLGIGIRFLEEGAQEVGRVRVGMPLGHLHASASGERFDPQEQIGFAQALILIVFLGCLSGLHRQRSVRRVAQLFTSFIEANERAQGIVGTLVDIQHVFHLGDIAGRGRADAPGLHLPGFERVFLSRSQTVVWSRASTRPSSITREVSRRTVQRA